MPPRPKLKFLSLFVPNLSEDVERYQAMLGIAPEQGFGQAPAPHPFAAKGPVIFQLGEIALALYECDGRTTHTGDVGIGLETDVDETVSQLREWCGQVFWGPTLVSASEHRLAIGVTPDRHFFEMVEPRQATAD